MTIQFTVPGKPIGKGRPRFAKRGSYVRTYTDDNTLIYENWVRECWKNGNFPKLTGPIQATVVGVFPIPKSISRKKREEMLSGKIPYTGKPDSDNLAKSVLDSLNGIAFDDDAQVYWLTAAKFYGETPCCRVVLDTEEAEA